MSFPNCFLDSFSHYATADLLGTGNGQKWSTVAQSTSTLTISPGNGLFGSSLRMVNTNNSTLPYLTKTLASLATWVVGFRFRLTALPTVGNSQGSICALTDGTTAQVSLNVNNGGTLQVMRNGNSVTGGTSSNVISINTWYYIEMMVTISSSISANSWQVNVNGSNWINVSAGQSSKNSSNATANTFSLLPGSIGGNGNCAATTWDICDLYVDGGGAVNGGAFWGDTKIECHWPIANGTYTAWATNGGNAVGCVSDETPNGDTNFLSDNTTGDKSTFTFQPLASTPSSIIAVQVCHTSRKADAGTRQIADTCRSGTTNQDGTTVNLGNTYQIWTNVLTQDPATSAAWTQTGLNAAEFGVKEIS